MRNPVLIIPLAIAATLSFLAFLVWSGPRTPSPSPVAISAPTVTPAPSATETAPAAAAPSTDVLLTSAPSGARVWIEGKDTGLVTPTRVTVPSKGFLLMLIKKGYRPYVDDGVLKKIKGAKFHVALTRKPRK